MNFFRQVLTGLRLLIVFTVLLGVVYPVGVWGIGQIAFDRQAQGSLIVSGDTVQGSTLIGQNFTGNEWFASRPSAGDYDGLASGGSNAGPSDADLIAEIEQRRAQIATRDGVSPANVPADAVTASASGLDPFISPAYAALQEARVARVRGLAPEELASLVEAATAGRTLGFLGEPRVNVVELNAALAAKG